MSQNKKKLIGSVQENLKKPKEEGLRREIRFLDPEGEGNNKFYPGYINEMDGTNEVSSTPVRIYANTFQKDGKTQTRFTVRKMLTAPQPAKNSDGAFVDGQGNVVQNENDAAQINRAITYNGTDRPVFITVAEGFTADKSYKGTPYGQTMFVGKIFDEETAKNIERKAYKAGNLKAAGKESDAKALYQEMNQEKKENGKHVSMFFTRNLAANLAQDLGSDFDMPRPASHDNKGNDIPF